MVEVSRIASGTSATAAFNDKVSSDLSTIAGAQICSRHFGRRAGRATGSLGAVMLVVVDVEHLSLLSPSSLPVKDSRPRQPSLLWTLRRYHGLTVLVLRTPFLHSARTRLPARSASYFPVSTLPCGPHTFTSPLSLRPVWPSPDTLFLRFEGTQMRSFPSQSSKYKSPLSPRIY